MGDGGPGDAGRPDAGRTAAGRRVAGRRVAVIAHRGASAAAPENTVEAFELAVDLGADGIELDVRCSADEHLVVHHDARLADGTAIMAVARRQLPEQVPDLATALDACAGAWVNLELKNDPREPDFDDDRRLAGAVLDLLARRADLPERWLISSFDLATIDAVRAASTPIRTAWLVDEISADIIGRTVAGGHHAVHPWAGKVDEVGVACAHAAGLDVNVWTCNDEDRIGELIAAGVDGICTDVPDLVRRLVPRP